MFKSLCSGSINRRGALSSTMKLVLLIIVFAIFLGFLAWIFTPLPDMVQRAVSYMVP